METVTAKSLILCHAMFASKLPKKVSIFWAIRHFEICLAVLARASAGRHDTVYLSTGVEAAAASKRYEFGDTINLDVNTTLALRDSTRRFDCSAQSRVSAICTFISVTTNHHVRRSSCSIVHTR